MVSVYELVINHIINAAECISYDISRHGVSYYYNGKMIAGYQLSNERDIDQELVTTFSGNEMYLKYSSNEFHAYQPKGGKTTCFFQSYLPKGGSNGQLYEFSNGSLEVFEINKQQKAGAYRKFDCQGNLLVSGFYRNAEASDEPSQVINPDTYEISSIPPTEVRCGSWKYYNENGDLLKEEVLGSCK